MSFEAEILQRKLSELLNWERRKRYEQILATLLCYSLLAGLLALPLHGLLPAGVSRWFIPVPFFVLLAPFMFLRRCWRREDSARALVRVDKALRFDERTVTAWELLERNETRAAALLVLKEAEEKLKTLDPRALFRRRWGWQAYLVFPLLFLWFGLLWFEFDTQFAAGLQPSAPKTLAQKLREFSRELQEKAKSEGLRESLQVGRELEKMAQKGIDAKTGDQRFKDELAGMRKRIGAVGKAAAEQPSFSAAESEQNLKELKAELDAARDLINFPDADQGMGELGQQWLDRLETLPQLKKQFYKEGQAAQRLSQNALKSLLDRLERQVSGELDRRTLLEAQQFLEQLMNQGQGEKGESHVRIAGKGEPDLRDEGARTKSQSQLPGKEPGKREEGFQPAPEFPAGAATHLKGWLGEGNSSGVVLKGKPLAGKSEISQQEVITSYRRQAEAELNTERVPAGLKETIKNYFLSLGMGEEQK